MYSNILLEIYIHENNIASLCNEIKLDIPILYLKSSSITQKEIEHEKYKNLKYLDLSNNKYVTSVNHLPQLEELDCSGYKCGINQEGILKCVHIRILNACNNYKITSVNHMTQLEELNCSCSCGINQEGISQCMNIQILDVSSNSNITSVNHLRKLQELNCSGYYGIDQEGISQCINIRILNASNNWNIISVNDVNGRLRPFTECPPEVVII